MRTEECNKSCSLPRLFSFEIDQRSVAVEVGRSLYIFGAERIISEIQLKVGRTGEHWGAVERGEGWKSLNSGEVGQIHTNFSHLPFLLIQTKKKLKCQNQDN